MLINFHLYLLLIFLLAPPGPTSQAGEHRKQRLHFQRKEVVWQDQVRREFPRYQSEVR